jgi:hypothetical protein
VNFQKVQIKFALTGVKAGEVDFICSQENINKHQPNLKVGNEKFISFFGGDKFLGEPQLVDFFEPANIKSIRAVLEHTIVIFNSMLPDTIKS